MSDNLRGIIAMTLSMAFFTAGDTLIKIVGRDLPVSEIMFLRGSFASVVIGAIGMVTGRWRQWRTLLTPLMGWRTLGEVSATLFFFAGLVRLPFADASAIGQLAPLAVTAGAALFFAEPVGWRRWTATIVGFLGVLLIMRPGTSAFNPAAILILVAVLGVALRDLVTWRIGTSIPVLLLTLAAASSVAVAGLALGLAETWVMPSRFHFGLIAIAAMTVLCGYVTTIVATRAGDISIVSPFRYTAIIFGLLGGVFVFAERLDNLMLAGIAIIVGAGIYTFRREYVRRLQAAHPAERPTISAGR